MSDELSTYLDNTYADYFSSFSNSVNLLWAADVKNGIPSMCTCIIGMPYNPLQISVAELSGSLNNLYVKNQKFRRIVNFGKDIASIGNTRYFAIVFPLLEQYAPCEWDGTEAFYPFADVKFGLRDFGITGGKLTMIDGKNLRDLLHSVLGITQFTQGTAKSRNNHISDYFQYWSRNYLARRLTKIDIDGGFFRNAHGDKVLIEIKRSNIPPLEKWLPTIKDHANYYAEYQFCRQNNMKFWLLHHDGQHRISENSKISFFSIKYVTPTYDPNPQFLKYDLPFGQLEIISMDHSDNSLEAKLAALNLNERMHRYSIKKEEQS